MTPEEIEALRIERRLERDREARRAERARLALPLPTEIPSPPEFAPLEAEPAAMERESEQAFESVKDLYPLPGQGAGSAMERERSRLQSERVSTTTSLPAGQIRATTEVDSYMLPTFRPTRIRRVDPDARFAEDPEAAQPQELSDRQLEVAILASGQGSQRLKDLTAESKARAGERQAAIRQVPSRDLVAARQLQGPAIEGERLYVDPTTGKLRKPTVGEEVIEAFAKQTVMSEASAKAAADRIAEANKEIERRINAGEEVSWYEAAGPYFSGILSTRDEPGVGTTETELGAALRSGLGIVSALAAEGYFRGLGYEVDRKGVPKDPNDFGLAVAQVREKLGLTEIINPLGALEEPLRAAAGKISPELAQQAVDALRSIPQLAIPLPGVATQGTEQGPTSMDPEGRRRVSGIEVPSVLEDPQGFYEAETRRLARSLAGGRTMADEFLDSPATRRWYANVYGDPDAAFWAGAVGDVFIPAGPGTLARAAKGLSKAAAGSKVASKAAAATIARAEALKGTYVGAAINPVADFAAAVTKGAPSDGRVVRRVAEKSIGTMNVEESKRAAARQAIQPTSNTIDEVRQDVGAANIFDQAEFDYFNRTFVRNVPDDMVMVTDRIAVPRALASKWKTEASRLRSEAIFRTPAESRFILSQVEAKYPAYADDLKNMYRILQNSRGRILSVSERKAFDKEWSRYAEKNLDVNPMDGADVYRKQPVDFSEEYVDLDWSRIPSAGIERILNAEVDAAMLKAIPQEARLVNDLTSAQVAMTDYAKGLGKILGDGPIARRLRAAMSQGGLKDETVASAIARRQIQAAAQTAIREEGAALAKLAKKRGSFVDALDELLAQRLSKAEGVDEPPAKVWDKALEAIYGDASVAKSVRANALADAANLPSGIVRMSASGEPEFARFPTVATLKAVDLLYARSGKFVTNNFASDMIYGSLLPAYEKALLKVFLEEAVKKRITQAAMESDELRAGIDFVSSTRAGGVVAAAEAEAFAEALKFATRDPSLARVALRAIDPDQKWAVRLYDPAASEIERKLSESGETLFAILAESIDPRLRTDITSMIGQGRDWAITNMAKNLENAVKYGYYIPNIPYVTMKMFSVPIISMITSGLARTGAATDQLFRRFINGGGLQLPDGRYFSPEDLEYEYRFHGLGLTEVESARVGALADDLIRDAKLAAAAGKGPIARMKAVALEAANPFSRTVGQRLAHAAELSFRRATFESRLLAGDSTEEAAEAARKSVLDYSASPDFVKNLIGKYVADASGTFQLAVELLAFASENTAVARTFAKANSERAKAEDPYGIHGDQALKSLGIIGIGESTYYLPSIGRAYAPFELGLAAVRNGNQMVAGLRRAWELDGAEAESLMIGTVIEDGLALTRSGLNAVLPAISRSIDAAIEKVGGNEKYMSNDVPDATPMDDASAFWAAAVYAHHSDLDRKNGDWDFFLSVFQPEFVLPGKGQEAFPGATDIRRREWAVRPEGMPYLVWGQDSETGKTLYRAFRPSKVGLMNVQILRAFPGSKLAETFGIIQAAMIEEYQAGASAPLEVRPDGAFPKLSMESPEEAAGFFLGQAPSAEDERRRQALELAAARGKTE